MIIIIDDIGNQRQLGERAIALPGNLTYAILPGLPWSRYLADLAQAKSREVMLHLPMANHGQLPLGPMGLTEHMNEAQWRDTLRQALDQVGHARGVNNHMGSLLTEQTEAMLVLMSELNAAELYFIDSLTSPQSIAYQTALNWQVPALKRHVFLDHEPTLSFIQAQFSQALAMTESLQTVVVIGHPYPATLTFLEWMLPLLEDSEVKLITPSEALAQHALQ
jgi:polysaccharide deacetylase 2 family uncharacterized protein YibQ